MVKRVGYDPKYAIDGLYNTQANPLPEQYLESYLEFFLDKAYCVATATWYNSDGSIKYSWTCSEMLKECTISATTPYYILEVHNFSGSPRVTDCKSGDRVKLMANHQVPMDRTRGFVVHELSIVAKTGEL